MATVLAKVTLFAHLDGAEAGRLAGTATGARPVFGNKDAAEVQRPPRLAASFI